MSVNYQNDSSFFMCLNVAGSGFNKSALSEWFSNTLSARFRFIDDPELLSTASNLKNVLDVYPGVKTIAIVSNPWARLKYAWNCISETKETDPNDPLSAAVSATTFEEFINNLESYTIENFQWYKTTTPQIDWLKYVDENNVEHKVDYILRQEHLEEDFQIIKDYFLTNNPILGLEPSVEYKDDYTDDMKNKVASLFAADIAEFGYTF